MMTRRAGRQIARYLLVGAMSAVLVGCGGGSGDNDPIFGVGDDSNGDGIPDQDVDGDGVVDDLNGDGIVDGDLDGDGIIDDLNGDGIADVDLDGDGIADDLDGNGVPDMVTEVSEDDPCGDESGTDNDSSTPTWDDNCTVARNGQFANSLYTAGIQRVVYCSGFGEASNVDVFADGDMGPATAAAIDAFQEDEGLVADTIVGAQTWGALQARLERIEVAPLDGGFDTYAVATTEGESARTGCDQALFYQVVEAAPSVTEPGATGGWTLARSAGSGEQVEFSVEPVNQRLGKR